MSTKIKIETTKEDIDQVIRGKTELPHENYIDFLKTLSQRKQNEILAMYYYYRDGDYKEVEFNDFLIGAEDGEFGTLSKKLGSVAASNIKQELLGAYEELKKQNLMS